MNTTMRAYKISEVAQILGVTRQSVHRLVVDGVIPCVKITDRIWRIPGKWVDEMVNGKTDKP